MKKNKFKSIDHTIKSWIELNSKNRGLNIDNDWWFASELGLCQRKMFLRRLEFPVEEKMNYPLANTALDGTAGHEWRQRACEDMGNLVAQEEKLRDEERRYSGRFDLLLWLEGKLVLADIKTENSFSFARRQRLPLTMRVKKNHKIQLASYIWAAQKKYKSLTEGRIYYADRGTGKTDEYIFKFNDEILKIVTDELDSLNMHWKNHTLPERTQTERWLCNYCPFKKFCAKVEGGDPKYNKMFKQLWLKKKKLKK
jgi:CRISPR/Cas system-associated exonuclease Cas4 (RecB family)